MALVVETGAGLATAESYISEADADTYHEKRGNTAWDSVTDKEANLRKATDYMLQNYRESWKGVRMTGTQALDWPRGFVYITPFLHGALGNYPYLVADNIVPVEVKNACAELALKASTGDLNPDLAKDIISQTVGPISTTYAASSPQQKRYRGIDMILRPYLSSTGGVSTSVARS
jgi:hypothetical protein